MTWGMISVHKNLLSLTWSHPTTLLNLFPHSVNVYTVDDTALRWREAMYMYIPPPTFIMYPYAQLNIIFTIRGDMSLINP